MSRRGIDSLVMGWRLAVALLICAIRVRSTHAQGSPLGCNTDRLTFSVMRPPESCVFEPPCPFEVAIINPGPGTGIGCDVSVGTAVVCCGQNICEENNNVCQNPIVVVSGAFFPADGSADSFYPVNCLGVS